MKSIVDEMLHARLLVRTLQDSSRLFSSGRQDVSRTAGLPQDVSVIALPADSRVADDLSCMRTGCSAHLSVLRRCCQVLVPVAFFGLMCIPKHYIKPQPLPRQILSQAIDLDMGLASKPGSTDYRGAQRLLTTDKCVSLRCVAHLIKGGPLRLLRHS